MPELDSETLVHTGLHTSNVPPDRTPRRIAVRVTAGPDKGAAVHLGARPIVIGGQSDCDLPLSDGHASRRHLELSLRGSEIWVKDLGSTNGTFYQGAQLAEGTIPSGATITLGDTSLTVAEVPIPTVKPSARRSFGALVADSISMREIFAVLELASPSEATVLIEGESGTGKELMARAIHDHSERAEGPFVVVDCSAIAENLIDSHLFGHVKGAFTGAVAERRGAFVEAKRGTLFLDELGELPLAAQARLLRALEDRTVQPVGSDRRVPVDVRVVAATHRDLFEMVQRERFRFDLFHRLAVVQIRIPPLRSRPEDIAVLVRSFYDGRGTDPGEIAGGNLEQLQAYAWPGNARELRNVLERAWVLAGPGGDSFRNLTLWLGPSANLESAARVNANLPFKDSKRDVVEDFERRYVIAVMGFFDGNISHAAEHAGLSRKHLRDLLQKHGLHPRQHED